MHEQTNMGRSAVIGHCDTVGQNSNKVLYFNCVFLIVYVGSDWRI